MQVTPVEEVDVIGEGTVAYKGYVITPAITVGAWGIIPQGYSGKPRSAEPRS